ncbi:MAG TPA: EamA family transporter [Gammaproteobacteria bacterium]|jgi:drug/metabolite transporter (DMT)-like permease|nr:EamA family transporter [Gammaproteobacteria bacterium]
MNDALLLFAVALLACSQILQKLGAARRLRGTRTPREWLRALLSPELIGAVVAIVAGTALWLGVLYRMDVSRAFPFLSLGTVGVVAASRLWLGEQVSARRWAGVVLIALGIALVAST